MEFYGDDNLSSADARVPLWLKLAYVFLPIWGVIWLFFFFNGSYGWFDAGYWNQLQKAALTTFPSETIQQE
ncbi:MAG: hypothetical protein H0T62_00410 [Parachlamydiaceae bacterium]|nr:hypothetical protein [Parachlamydiaceae bacterium]